MGCPPRVYGFCSRGTFLLGVIMFRLLMLFALVSCLGASALYNVGDRYRNACWESLSGKVCVDDAIKAKNVQVLLYSAGYCAPCHNEFKELVPKLERFAGKKVAFISLSAGNYDSSKDPDEAFLRSWSSKYAIEKAKATWVVALSPRNPGRDFFEPAMIPSVVILDSGGRITFKATAPGVTRIISEIERLKP